MLVAFSISSEIRLKKKSVRGVYKIALVDPELEREDEAALEVVAKKAGMVCIFSDMKILEQ